MRGSRSSRAITHEICTTCALPTHRAQLPATYLLRVYELLLGFRLFDSPPSLVSSVSVCFAGRPPASHPASASASHSHSHSHSYSHWARTPPMPLPLLHLLGVRSHARTMALKNSVLLPTELVNLAFDTTVSSTGVDQVRMLLKNGPRW